MASLICFARASWRARSSWSGYGIRGPVASIDPQPQIQLRQALIRRLRVLVPAIFGVALISGIAVTLLERLHPGLVFRCAGLLALFVFISITLGWHCAINQATLTWNAAEPPEGWRAMINRWERLDTARTWAAIAAFLFFLAAAALR